VRDYVRRATATGRPISDLLALDDTMLTSVLSGDVTSAPQEDPRWTDLGQRLPTLSRELHKTGVTKLLLWQEYTREQPKVHNPALTGHQNPVKVNTKIRV